MSRLFINKVIYFNYIYTYFFYNECNFYYFYSKSNSRKTRNQLKFIFINNNNELIKKLNLFSYKYRSNSYLYYLNTLLESKLNKYLKESFYSNKGKIKIVGRGWKIVKYSYQLIVKLGFSHSFFLVLYPLLKYKLKKKKKKYYVFYSVFYNQLNILLSRFNLMRIPDVYTKKGIFNRNIIL